MIADNTPGILEVWADLQASMRSSSRIWHQGTGEMHLAHYASPPPHF